jgi:hypothetical protein
MHGKDFKVGDYGIITSVIQEEDDEPDFSDETYLTGHKHKPKITSQWEGVPFKVLAVNLPFMIVEFPLTKRSLDVRTYNFVRCEPVYFAEWKRISLEMSKL